MNAPKMSRREILVGIGAIFVGQSIRTGAADGADWHSISPNEAGFTSDLEALLDKAIAEKRVWNLHGVVVVRNGGLVLEHYFEGDDDARGRPLGTVAFTANTLHDLRSASKSIVGLLYGIALADGKVSPPDAPLFASFPEYTDLAADPARNRWTIYNALTMTMGTDWDELSVPYSDPTNSEVCNGYGSRSLPLYPWRAGRDGAGSTLDLQWRRDRIVGANHCERHWETIT